MSLITLPETDASVHAERLRNPVFMQYNTVICELSDMNHRLNELDARLDALTEKLNKQTNAVADALSKILHEMQRLNIQNSL